MKAALKIDNVHKVYEGGTHALKGLNLEVEKGEFFALLGPNGSGKSTLINTIAGPTKKTSGSIEIMGLDIDKHRQETKFLIGIVPQEISFDSFFNVNDILKLQSGYYGIRNNQAQIDDILEKLNLQDKKFTNSRALSGGMKRRLLVAKALVHNPKVLILDEPTAGVDVELRHNLWKYMRHLNEEGLTILLTTHYLEEAESLCKRTAIIHNGQLVALDDTKKLITSMGNAKVMTVSFPEKIGKIPEEFKDFNPERVNDHELNLKFKNDQLNKVIAALDKFKLPISDIDLKGQNLEDVFIELTYKRNG